MSETNTTWYDSNQIKSRVPPWDLNRSIKNISDVTWRAYFYAITVELSTTVDQIILRPATCTCKTVRVFCFEGCLTIFKQTESHNILGKCRASYFSISVMSSHGELSLSWIRFAKQFRSWGVIEGSEQKLAGLSRKL